jgi:hypothetical protein
VNDEFSGYRWNGTNWEVIGIDLNKDYAEFSQLATASAAAVVSGSALGYASASAYTDSAVSNLVNSAPEALNTLNELAAALGDDANFATTVTNSLSNKLDSSSASATYATITTVNTKQDISSAMVVVNHGSTASTARPTGVGAVYWIGSVQPTNALAYDMWWEL